MKIRAGYEISYTCPQPTPMILMLSVHPSRAPDLLSPSQFCLAPASLQITTSTASEISATLSTHRRVGSLFQRIF
jgi:hypothetical protein